MKISYHALKRWNERFGGDWEKEFATAIPFGGQRGKDISMLSDNGVVFIVVDNCIKTVLTKTQAIANMAMFNNKVIDAIKIKSEINHRELDNHYTQTIIELCRKQVEKMYDRNSFKNPIGKKTRNKEFRALGFGDKWLSFYKQELSKAIVEYNNKIRRQNNEPSPIPCLTNDGIIKNDV